MSDQLYDVLSKLGLLKNALNSNELLLRCGVFYEFGFKESAINQVVELKKSTDCQKKCALFLANYYIDKGLTKNAVREYEIFKSIRFGNIDQLHTFHLVQLINRLCLDYQVLFKQMHTDQIIILLEKEFHLKIHDN